MDKNQVKNDKSVRDMFDLLLCILKGINVVFKWLSILSLLAIAVVVLVQVVSRFCLPMAPVWTEELSRYLFIYLIILASGLIIFEDKHVRLDMLVDRLNPRGQAVFAMLSHLIVGIFALIILPHAWKYAQVGRFQTSPTLYLPMIYVFFATVIFFVLTAFYSFTGFICAALRFKDPQRFSATNDKIEQPLSAD